MKLRYDDNVLGIFTLVFYIYLVMSFCVLVLYGVCIEKTVEEGGSIFSLVVSALYTSITLLALIALASTLRKGMKQVRGEEKKVGEKVAGRIVGVSEGRGKGNRSRGTLEVSYHNGQDLFEVRNDKKERCL